MISASHALNTAENSEMNLYVANGNIGIYVGDAVINGIIYAPNGTVQLCGSDIEVNGMIIAKEIQISAENFIINENPDLSLAAYVKDYNSQILAAYADYDLESKLFNVNLFSTIEGGTYSIYTSLDGEKYELNGTTDKKEYSFGIDENVPELYIKATQTFDNGFVLTSNIVKMIADEDYGYVMEQTDTDGDGLIDLYEHIFGSDKNAEDTDGDGLSDYIEVMIIGTDPLYKDTDENGVEDGDEDYDGDRLTNLQEIDYGTSLTLKDTDNDGLTDYEEIFVYDTDPLNPDTDGDGINDGDEIKLGLDPLSTDSDNDGVPDNEEIIAQTVDNSDLDAINSDNDYKLTIDINAAGYANNSTIVEDSGFSYITSTNPAVLGKVVAIDYDENLKLDSAVLKFEIPQATVNSARNYPNSNELAGLNRYAIFHYSKEYNIMYPVNVEYDEASSTLKVSTKELGDYFVVDLDKWFFEMGIVPDQYGNESEISTLSLDYDEEICYTDSDKENEKYTIEELEEIFDFSQPFGATEIEATEQSEAVSAVFSAPRMSTSFSAEKKIKPVDVVFIIDCTDNLQDNFENVKSNVIYASEEIFAMCDSARICIIQFWASKTPEKSGWYSNSQVVSLKRYVNSIEQSIYTGNSLHGAAMTMAADLNYRSNAKKFSFLIFDEYSQWSEDMTGEMIKNGIQHIVNKGINFSILRDHTRTDLSDNSQNLIEITDGYDGSNLGSFSADVVKHISDYTDKVGDSVEEPEPDPKPEIKKNCVDVSGHVMMSDFSMPYIYDEDSDHTTKYIIKYTLADYDKDGLKDYEEVDWANLKSISTNTYECWTYYDWMEEFQPYNMGNILWDKPVKLIKVLPILSNPWEKDSDWDGIDDKTDVEKLHENYIENMFKLSPLNNSSNPVYIEIDKNTIYINARILFTGDYNRNAYIGDKTYADICIEGIKSKWQTKFDGSSYDFIPGLSGETIVNIEAYFEGDEVPIDNKVIIEIDGDYPTAFQYIFYNLFKKSTQNPHSVGLTKYWSLVSSKKIYMTHYDMRNPSVYTLNQFMSTVAHEFGHTLGLSDAYPKANGGLTIINNAEISDGIFGESGNIMYSNGIVYPNDIEMMLYAFCTNKGQFYYDVNGNQKSNAIKIPQEFK